MINKYKLITLVFITIFTQIICGCSGKDSKLGEVSKTDGANLLSFDISNDYEDTVYNHENTFDENCNNQALDVNESSANRKILVYVCGYVKAPGVYELAMGSRVVDALEKAGGFLEDANTVYINLARELKDGEQIYFPSVYEDASSILATEFENSSGESLENKSDFPININLADFETLCLIPGIGNTKAEAIIAYRQANGSFSDSQEIMNVSGIGESTYNNIKYYICTN